MPARRRRPTTTGETLDPDPSQPAADNSIVVESTVVETGASRQAEAAGLLAAVADPVRWRLVAELTHRGKRCVCDLQRVGGVAPNVLSFHLMVMREAGLVTATRRGRWVDYELEPVAARRLRQALPVVTP